MGSNSVPLVLSVVAAVFAVLYAVSSNHTYVFDKVELQQIARDAIRAHNSSDAIVKAVVTELQRRHPKHIAQGDYDSLEWLFNNAGGAMGSMTVLHASFSEYVIIFGTALGTEGHTGRFYADDYFTILAGEQWAYSAGGLTKEVYRPGDQHHLRWGQAKQYRMPDECWALEYARGHIPTMMPFGLWDTFFSTVDFYTMWQTVRISASQMLAEALQGKF